jgi:hypothetical protein
MKLKIKKTNKKKTILWSDVLWFVYGFFLILGMYSFAILPDIEDSDNEEEIIKLEEQPDFDLEN